MAIKQRKIVVSGPSTISAADAGLAALGGFVTPLVVDRVLSNRTWAPDSVWLTDYAPQLGAAAGVLVALPIGYWRGMGVGLLTAVLGLTYGLALLIDRWIGEMGTTPPAPPIGPAPGATVGLGLLRSVPQSALRAANRPSAAVADLAMSQAFGSNPY